MNEIFVKMIFNTNQVLPLFVIWSNFCFTNILVCWLFLGQDWRGPYAPFGVVDDRRGWPGDPTWFQTSLLVIWSNFCFTNILISWLFLGQDWRGPYAPFGVVNDRKGWPGYPNIIIGHLEQFLFSSYSSKRLYLEITVKISFQELAHPPRFQLEKKVWLQNIKIWVSSDLKSASKPLFDLQELWGWPQTWPFLPFLKGEMSQNLNFRTQLIPNT